MKFNLYNFLSTLGTAVKSIIASDAEKSEQKVFQSRPCKAGRSLSGN